MGSKLIPSVFRNGKATENCRPSDGIRAEAKMRA